MQEFAALWQAAEKVVYSRTLAGVTTGRTRLEREFDPEAVRRLKAETTGDIGIGGPELAGQAIRAGLVDEFHLLVAPVVVGGGKPWLPRGVRLPLELVDERRFAGGMVYLCYRAGTVR
jgi:dihydrofolate reductase